MLGSSPPNNPSKAIVPRGTLSWVSEGTHVTGSRICPAISPSSGQGPRGLFLVGRAGDDLLMEPEKVSAQPREQSGSAMWMGEENCGQSKHPVIPAGIW